jgi:hypothetical protein
MTLIDAATEGNLDNVKVSLQAGDVRLDPRALGGKARNGGRPPSNGQTEVQRADAR